MDRFLASIERRAFRTARIATGDDDEAMDVVQDAMVRLVQRYGARREDEWPPLFHRILQNRIRDWYRRSKVRNRWRRWFGSTHEQQGMEDPLESVPDPSAPNLVEQLAKKRATVELEQALRALPLRQQQAFLLRAWEELDVAGTARAMGCSEGSVKTHYFRAVQALRERLGDRWP